VRKQSASAGAAGASAGLGVHKEELGRPADRAGRKRAWALPTVRLVQCLTVVLEADDFVFDLQFLAFQFCEFQSVTCRVELFLLELPLDCFVTAFELGEVALQGHAAAPLLRFTAHKCAIDNAQGKGNDPAQLINFC
jgi:hypothetical protein